MDKYGRELDLILLLTGNSSYTAKEISERLGITRRNLYYYFDYLRRCGFRLVKNRTRYTLDRDTAFFRVLHDNIALTEDEAAYICKHLENDGEGDVMAANVKAKLARTFNLDYISDPAIQKQVNHNTALLKEAMLQKRMVAIHNYSSPHSSTVSDRIVEPFMMMDNGRDIRCHEIKSGKNKTFKISRMGSVEIMDVPWIHESEHKQAYTDIFMFCGEERHHIELRLGQLSHNLLAEEYPASIPFTTEGPQPGQWTFEADVVSFLGIGRFVIGLYDDIQIVGSDEFGEYVRNKIKAFAGI